MHFEKNCTYHVYNRSIKLIFKEKSNYLFFLKKIRNHILPYADVLAYCLMPNHFHLMINVRENSVIITNELHRPSTQELSKQIGLMLSSYTQALNKKSDSSSSVLNFFKIRHLKILLVS